MKIAQVRSYALSLPEVTEAPHFHYASFRVKGKIFVTVPPQDSHIHVFVADHEREIAPTLYPEFVEKLLWGGKVVGVRVTLGKAKPDAVNQLVKQAWMRKAPKRLAALVAAGDA